MLPFLEKIAYVPSFDEVLKYLHSQQYHSKSVSFFGRKLMNTAKTCGFDIVFAHATFQELLADESCTLNAQLAVAAF